MFNEILLYILDPGSRFLFLFTYFGFSITFIIMGIKPKTKTDILRVIKLVFIGFIIAIIAYFSIRFLITRQYFNDGLYMFFLFLCCLYSLVYVQISYFYSDENQEKSEESPDNTSI